jgi:hypothetical protein
MNIFELDYYQIKKLFNRWFFFPSYEITTNAGTNKSRISKDLTHPSREYEDSMKVSK